MHKRRLIFWSCFAAVLLALVREFWPICPPPFPRWNCETQEINIQTGQARYRRYRFFIRVRNETKETALSELITKPVNVAEIAPWHTVNQFAPPSFRISPHFRFHGALSQASNFKNALAFSRIAKDRQHELATEILHQWQTTGGYFGADDVIMELYDEAISSN